MLTVVIIANRIIYHKYQYKIPRHAEWRGGIYKASSVILQKYFLTLFFLLLPRVAMKFLIRHLHTLLQSFPC